jgi:hypothetical protein
MPRLTGALECLIYNHNGRFVGELITGKIADEQRCASNFLHRHTPFWLALSSKEFTVPTEFTSLV